MELLSIIEEAGWTIWVLIASSIASLAIIIERFYALRKSVTVPKTLEKNISSVCDELSSQSEKTYQNSCLGRVVLALGKSGLSKKEDLESVAESASRNEIAYLEKFLTTLGSISAMAPLMGLLGTVIGMIEIFASQNAAGSDPHMLARGISVALYNTAMGLIVAIPSMMFYRHFRSRVEATLMDIEVSANHVIHLLSKNR